MSTSRDTLYTRRPPRGRKNTHTLSVLVENKPGVLARVSGMFARRGMNIELFAVGPTEDERISRMTIVLKVEAKPLDVVIHQLDKLVNVIHIEDLPENDAVERELVLVKVAASAGQRSQVLEIADIFRAKIVDAGPESLTLEATGTHDKLHALIEMLTSYGILEIARTGATALARGRHTINDAYLSAITDHEPAAETA